MVPCRILYLPGLPEAGGGPGRSPKPGWKAAREGDTQRLECAGAGRTWQPSRWLFHFGLPIRGAPASGASLPRGLKVPQITSLTAPADWHLLLCCRLTASLQVAPETPRRALDPLLYFNHPCCPQAPPQAENSALCPLPSLFAQRPTVLPPCSYWRG